MEAGVLYDNGDRVLHWHAPEDRSAVSLPDSSTLWNVIWRLRDEVWGFAHSHPGRGVPSPSHTDLTTFAAIESGLGKRLMWPIVTEDDYLIFRWGNGEYEGWRSRLAPSWIDELRRLSRG